MKCIYCKKEIAPIDDVFLGLCPECNFKKEEEQALEDEYQEEFHRCEDYKMGG